MSPFFITKIAGYAAFCVSILHDFSLYLFAISPLFCLFVAIWPILCRNFNAQWFRLFDILHLACRRFNANVEIYPNRASRNIPDRYSG